MTSEISRSLDSSTRRPKPCAATTEATTARSAASLCTTSTRTSDCTSSDRGMSSYLPEVDEHLWNEPIERTSRLRDRAGTLEQLIEIVVEAVQRIELGEPSSDVVVGPPQETRDQRAIVVLELLPAVDAAQQVAAGPDIVEQP